MLFNQYKISFDECEDIKNFVVFKIYETICKNEKCFFFFRKHEFHLEFNEIERVEHLSYNSLIESLFMICNNELKIFFDKLILDIYLSTEDTFECLYSHKKDNYNKNTNKLKVCKLIFILPKNINILTYIHELKTKIIDELTNAYNDFKSYEA